jgi:3-oxoacyl-[acyl-carrier protein] reductase
MVKLQEKVAIITGAGREGGFGRAIALEMAKEGANVVVSDICAMEDLNKRVAEIKALGRDALAVVCDVRSKDSVKAMVKAALEKFGKVNILVNNAGFARLDKFLEIDEEVWDQHQDVMVKGSFLCAQVVIPEMLKSGEGGKIINIASVAGLAGWKFSEAYCTAKFGQVGLTKSLAHEFAGQNINVNAICPGLQAGTSIGNEFATGFARCLGISTDEAIASFLTTMPQGKMGTGADVAKVAVFLASPDSDHITGVALEVTGGQRW